MMTTKSEHCWFCDCETKGYIFWHSRMEETTEGSRKIIRTNK